MPAGKIILFENVNTKGQLWALQPREFQVLPAVHAARASAGRMPGGRRCDGSSVTCRAFPPQ